MAGAAPAAGQDVSETYTTDADFASGTLVDVNSDFPNNDQLQLDAFSGVAPYIFVPASGRGTVLRIDVESGAILGEYRTAPQGQALDPSRTVTDSLGNCWAGNRARDLLGMQGSVVKFGLVVGGTRVNADGTPNPNGGYLAPPYDFNTCVDRDGDGLIRTSIGLGDVLDWPDVTDGAGGAGGGAALVEDALDECILVYQITECPNVRQISVDANDDIWAGGYPFQPTCFQHLSGADGSYIQTVNNFAFCGGFSGTLSAGVLWSVDVITSELMRLDTSSLAIDCRATQANPGGAAVDAGGNVWVAGSDSVQQYDAGGNLLTSITATGSGGLVGIAITPDGDLWVASFDTDQVYRIDPGSGTSVAIQTDEQPNGMSVDANGKVWVVCLESDSAQRIDPMTDAVDLTVDLGAGAQPFSPSEMTASVPLDMTVPQGTWDVITDGGQPDVMWDAVSWNSSELAGSSLAVSARAANLVGDLAGLPFVPVSNGGATGLTGRFIEVLVEFAKAPDDNVSPILFDLTVEGTYFIPPLDDCDRFNRRTPGSLLLYPEFDNRDGTVSILTLTNRDCLGEDVLVEFIYIDEELCEEFNRTDLLTPCDTLSVITNFHNPNQEQGFVYAFAKSPLTGEPSVHDHLIGNLLIVNGLEAFEYSVNPVAFKGLGDGTVTNMDGDDVRDLDGVEYEPAPAEILVPRFLGQWMQGGPQASGAPVHSELVLIGLTGGQEFDTTIDFLIYNDNEEVFSSEHTFRCWEKPYLLDISGIFANDFLANWTNDDPQEILGHPSLESGWFRIDGAVATSLTTTIHDPAVYAVLVERVGSYAVADLPFELCSQLNGDLVGSGLEGDR